MLHLWYLQRQWGRWALPAHFNVLRQQVCVTVVVRASARGTWLTISITAHQGRYYTVPQYCITNQLTMIRSLCPGATNIQCCTSSSPASCGPPSVNAATVALIKEFEGFVKSPAPDPIGLPTVGYGHLCKTKGCSEVPYPFPLSEAQAAALLQSDLKV